MTRPSDVGNKSATTCAASVALAGCKRGALELILACRGPIRTWIQSHAARSSRTKQHHMI
eukprot:9021783-Heterocapsa_arctica.AAC.1